MTQAEFQALPLEQQQALMKQRMQSQSMRKDMEIDYGAMDNPYGASPQRNTGPPPQARPQPQMPAQQQQQQGGGGGGGINPSQFMGKGAAGSNATGAMMSNASMPAATVYPTGAGSMAGSTAAAEMAAGQGVMTGAGSGGTVAMSPAVTGAAAPAASGGAGGGGMMAAAGPWAALAAAIAINETQARKQGRRDEDPMSHAVDMFSGAALEQDAEALGDKIGGPLGKFTEFSGEMGNPEGVFKNFKKSLKPWEWF